MGETLQTIYFDYNATTKLDPLVREAMLPFLDEIYGNPSSIHHIGRRARACLDDARDRVASVWLCKPSEVVFTSGGTESNNLAIFGAARLLRAKGRHLITSPTEHHAVLHCFDYLAKKEGFEVTFLPVDSNGRVQLADLAALVRADTTLVSIMAANNETGTLQPVAELGAFCRERGILFHTDAVQWFGKEPFTSIHQFNADLVSVCGHKFHGPKGAGALFIRSPLLPEPILFGGGHENERRAGTENLAAVIGLAEAIDRFWRAPIFPHSELTLFSSLLAAAASSIPGVLVCSTSALSLANTVSFVVEDCDSISLLAGLDLAGICASSGSACSAGSIEPSHVLKAMGFTDSLAASFIRFSLGRSSSQSEVASVVEILPQIISRARLGR